MALQLLGLAAGLAGGLLGSGKKAKVPKYQPVNATAEQGSAIAGNIANFGESSRLAEMTNNFNQDQLEAKLRRAIPNYDELINKSSKLISTGLSGELAPDVAGNIKRNAAEKSLAGGFGSSGASRNLEARDLGLTSLDISQRSLDKAMQFVSTLKGVSVSANMGAESMFVTPAQRIAAASANSSNDYNAKLAAANASAGPDPMLSSIGGFLSQIGGMAYSAGVGGQSAGSWLGTNKNEVPSWMYFNTGGVAKP